MEQLQRIFGDEKFVTGVNGEIEAVLLSISEYAKLVDIIENQKLADFIMDAEQEITYSKQEALRFLEID